jgi:cohesin domain-containing protein/PEP-CTERM motif-containing protein
MTMKIATLIVGAAALWFTAQGAQAIPIVSVSAPAGPVTVGSNVIVNIVISGVTDLYSFQFDLNFNPTILAPAAPTEGSFLSAGGATFFIPGVINGGTVAATAGTLLTAVSGVNGGGTLASFDFTAIGSGTSGLTAAGVLLYDSGLNSLASTSTGASLTVTPSSVPEPASLALFGFGSIGVLLRGRRRPARQ